MIPKSPFFARFTETAARHGSRPAIVDASGTLTHAALAERASGLAGALTLRGLAGARIGILTGPGAAWVGAFLAVLQAGGMAVALSPLYPEAELRPLVEAARVSAILVDPASLDLATRVAGSASVLDVTSLEGSPAPAALTDGSTPGLLLFTSGTTGRPKGAILTHGNLDHQTAALREAWGFTPEDVLLHTLPLHHLHGIGVALLVALSSGACVRFSRFEPELVWERLALSTVLMGVPTQHRKLFDAFDRADASTRERWTTHARALRLVTSGSAALPRSLGERWRSLTGQYPVERYGMTEIGIVLSNPREGERRPGAVGLPLSHVEVRVVGEEGADVPADWPGELWVRAPTVFAGYDANDRATEEAFADGWFRTGDTVSRAEDGYVTILGRTSVDILKSGGYKLSALEIEDSLREHACVADAAVVGIADETWGEAAVAAVVIRPGPAVGEDELRAWARQRMAPYKVPKRVLFFDDLPRNALGKVKKGELVERVQARLGKSPA